MRYMYSPCSYVAMYTLKIIYAQKYPGLSFADSNEQGKEDLTPPSFICLVGRQSVDEGGVRQRREGSEEGGRGQTKEGSESLLVVQELEF